MLKVQPAGHSTTATAAELPRAAACLSSLSSVRPYPLAPLRIIQKRAVYLPPAWSLAALVGFGTLFGGMGIALATPILAVARIMVLRLYVEDLLEGGRRRKRAGAHRCLMLTGQSLSFCVSVYTARTKASIFSADLVPGETSMPEATSTA